jgi:hypothetical protein
VVRLYDNVRMTVAAPPGMGDVLLGSAQVARRSFADAGALDGDNPVSVRFDDGDAWELSYVTYHVTGPRLTGRTLLASSTGSLLDLGPQTAVASVLFQEDLTGGGGTGFPEAPIDTLAYGRQDAGWTRVLAITNDILDGGNF